MSEDLNDEMAQASTAIFIQRGIDAVRAKVHSVHPSKEVCECCGADIPVARQLASPMYLGRLVTQFEFESHRPFAPAGGKDCIAVFNALRSVTSRHCMAGSRAPASALFQ